MAEVGAFCGQTTKTYIDIISKNTDVNLHTDTVWSKIIE